MNLLMDMGRMNMCFLQYDVCSNKRTNDKTFYDKITIIGGFIYYGKCEVLWVYACIYKGTE